MLAIFSPYMKPTLNIIGCGKLGRTLAHLWHTSDLVRIGNILNRRIDSAREATDFIGAGTAIETIEQLSAAELWLIATPDGEIASTSKDLANQSLLSEDNIVFHCSGALGSDILKNPRQNPVASVHPIHSFADPKKSIGSFAGSYCACEGDPIALQQLKPLFAHLGAHLFDVDGQAKTVYHAASVMACNNLVGLLDASLQCFKQAGVDPQLAKSLLLPIVHQTVDNTLQGSPTQALTGPVSRGDQQTVTHQQQALDHFDSDILDIYNSLGRQVLKVARQQGLDDNQANTLQQLFSKVPQ
ncbi:MAG: Rossmann-like and DUF2520 domain-containing protein [Candidatus Pelagadaptatus aseana]|uniref:Rossmann-like and DUF2520 domain-containing protein n=1 Tax=Candidatus Pelagadaptatus aseana TaxID=3120508 RepID=UPI0039B1FA23